MKSYPLADDPGRAVTFEPSEAIVERVTVCWASSVDILGGRAWPMYCIHTVDEAAPHCPVHGDRHPPKGS